jgi:hypothetical protein
MVIVLVAVVFTNCEEVGLYSDPFWSQEIKCFLLTCGIVKVKVKFTLEEAMQAQSGSRGIALLFL